MNVNDLSVNTGISNMYASVPVSQEVDNSKAVESNNEAVSDVTGSIERQFIDAVEKANNITKGSTECQFSIHKQTKQILIKLVDTKTKEVIKEIPPEKILDAFATMCETAGLFVDKRG